MSEKRILVVEDDDDIRDLVVLKLSSAGHAVESAIDGPSGLEKALSGGYDALVCDVTMPGMSGIDLLRALREAGISTPTLMLTAKSQDRDVEAGFGAGADDYVTKPFSPRALLARVNALLAKS